MGKPRSLTVRDVMSTDVVTVDPNDKLSVADDVMRLGRIRHMPVVDEDGTLVGIVSQRDLFHNALLRALGYGTHAQETTLDTYFVKDAMHAQVVTIAPDASLAAAARAMQAKKIGCLPVMADGTVVGVITEGDFVALYATAEGDQP